ncbi:MAG: hypothetical protein SFU53_12855 [Terrimicrobiaceae bacterium]|nr:hypothetical protein [Terrimicrobiaceae bacterium]
MNEQLQKAILLPPTHEQSTPSFHVASGLADRFQAFLADHGLTPWEPPEVLDKPAAAGGPVVEFRVPADTPQDGLEKILKEFLEQHSKGDVA